MKKKITETHHIPKPVYNKAWDWAAKEFGTIEGNPAILTAQGCDALVPYAVGFIAGRRSRLRKRPAPPQGSPNE